MLVTKIPKLFASRLGLVTVSRLVSSSAINRTKNIPAGFAKIKESQKMFNLDNGLRWVLQSMLWLYGTFYHALFIQGAPKRRNDWRYALQSDTFSRFHRIHWISPYVVCPCLQIRHSSQLWVSEINPYIKFIKCTLGTKLFESCLYIAW